mgnify:CR=1 FL=1
MKRFSAICLFTGFLFFSQSANSQAMGGQYKTALGLRFSPTAITLKHFTSKQTALEGLLSFWKDGVRFTGLYEWHGPIAGADGLKWYVGGGPHVDFWDNGYRNRNNGNGGAGLGVTGVLGLDYKFVKAPINLALDWMPNVTFIGGNYTNLNWVGLSVRFAIK